VTTPAAGKARASHRSRIRRAATIVLAAGFAAIAAAAHAQTFVLVYVEGDVMAMPSGVILSKGGQINGDKLVQLGPADKAIFISQSGNVVHHSGPYCGVVEQTQNGDSGTTQSAGCPK
jgi:hypothetical protein